tara:strand:- start:47 stop:706 length:660 start_codon:yes stop_codon:yes gene_type:complete
MANLTTDKNLDKHLKPVKSGGEDTSLELATKGNGARVHGDLLVDGSISSKTIHAGEILGYTVIGLDETPSKYDVLASMNPVHDDLKVSFIVPENMGVEIMVSIYVDTDSARPLTFGLSSTSATDGFTTIGAKYENHTWFGDETDGQQHTHRWYLDPTYISTIGVGQTRTFWFAAGCTQASRMDLRWGGDSSSVADSSEAYEYQPFVMRATALPQFVYTG